MRIDTSKPPSIKLIAESKENRTIPITTLIEKTVFCPSCHQAVETQDYFCRNCGKNLKTAPLPTDLTAQMMVYLKSALLPPWGLFLGLKYFGQKDQKSRIIGMLAFGITLIVILVTINLTMTVMNSVNNQLDSVMSY